MNIICLSSVIHGFHQKKTTDDNSSFHLPKVQSTLNTPIGDTNRYSNPSPIPAAVLFPPITF